jgi:hypothetical protein
MILTTRGGNFFIMSDMIDTLSRLGYDIHIRELQRWVIP